jgi:hypothetical protein
MSDTPYLTPTDDEADRLRLHLTRWDDLDAWPKSVSVAILRGSQAVEQLVEALGVTPKQVRYGARQLQHCGLLYDGATRKYHLR